MADTPVVDLNDIMIGQLQERIEALERLAAAEHDRGDYLAGAEPVGGTESLYLRLDAARKEVEALATREKARTEPPKTDSITGG